MTAPQITRAPGRLRADRPQRRRLASRRTATLAPFSACGIELEYMLVDARSFAVSPVADALLAGLAGRNDACDIELDGIGWSNELVAHVVELKNPRPVRDLATLLGAFPRAVRDLDAAASRYAARLMPSAMHPWMDPVTETRLWPHDPAGIYRTYDRIFDCSRHGWANLQSMHVNLPFDDDASFVRLHDAIRLVLPILPALAAASPIADGRPTGWVDYRLEVYRGNACSFPAITGQVIPEPVSSAAEYRTRILAPMYRSLGDEEAEGVLAHEWLNSRGAIPRFDRSAIEIRVIDVQECPAADLAIAAATCALVRDVYDRGEGHRRHAALPAARLAAILSRCARDGERALVDDVEYLALLGHPGLRCSAGELWNALLERVGTADEDAPAPIGVGIPAPLRPALDHILDRGPLARRILSAAGPEPSRERLRAVAHALADCLREGRLFDAADVADSG